MNLEQINNLFDNFGNFSVLVVGDVMIDSYLWGKVERISPEAPVPIITSTKRENRLGGAANVAMNLKYLGANPILGAVIGDDEKGRLFLKLMKKRALPTEGIVQSKHRMTTIKTRVISQNQHILRVDQEKTHELKGQIEELFIKQLEDILTTKKIHAVVFEDYDKGIITKKLIQRIVQLSIRKNIPTLVDPKKKNFLHYDNVSLFKPNLKEIGDGLKIDIEKGSNESLFDAAKILHNKGIKYIFVTLSERGVFISNAKKFASIPAEIRDIADVSGAGDTVISIASLCLASGIDMKNIAIISNLGGGLVCEKVGVVPIKKELLRKECIAYFNKNGKAH
ncbi:MAG: D-glycero-beta-D-manno-heptose-7-phosphate kinase [Bacteroidia bacterium]|nr:MAG: D-glycero-beta-D-manno-heptose-7-phosphate kinase [Bacteroidia bacterium]